MQDRKVDGLVNNLGDAYTNYMSIDELNFSKPSVSRAMKLLKENNYIEMDIDSHIILTEEGRKKAEAVYDRHNTINEFLIKLGVSKEQAEIDACRIEHIISEETLSCIKKALK